MPAPTRRNVSGSPKRGKMTAPALWAPIPARARRKRIWTRANGNIRSRAAAPKPAAPPPCHRARNRTHRPARPAARSHASGGRQQRSVLPGHRPRQRDQTRRRPFRRAVQTTSALVIHHLLEVAQDALEFRLRIAAIRHQILVPQPTVILALGLQREQGLVDDRRDRLQADKLVDRAGKPVRRRTRFGGVRVGPAVRRAPHGHHRDDLQMGIGFRGILEQILQHGDILQYRRARFGQGVLLGDQTLTTKVSPNLSLELALIELRDCCSKTDEPSGTRSVSRNERVARIDTSRLSLSMKVGVTVRLTPTGLSTMVLVPPPTPAMPRVIVAPLKNTAGTRSMAARVGRASTSSRV